MSAEDNKTGISPEEFKQLQDRLNAAEAQVEIAERDRDQWRNAFSSANQRLDVLEKQSGQAASQDTSGKSDSSRSKRTVELTDPTEDPQRFANELLELVGERVKEEVGQGSGGLTKEDVQQMITTGIDLYATMQAWRTANPHLVPFEQTITQKAVQLPSGSIAERLKAASEAFVAEAKASGTQIGPASQDDGKGKQTSTDVSRTPAGTQTSPSVAAAQKAALEGNRDPDVPTPGTPEAEAAEVDDLIAQRARFLEGRSPATMSKKG